MKRRSRILVWIAACILALIVVLVVIVATFDWNRARPWLDRKVSAAMGRTFVIKGDLSMHWGRDHDASGVAGWIPGPHFRAKDIRISNPSWAKQPDFARLKQIDFSLSLFPLLAHRIVIPHVQLGKPQLDLERLSDGRASWDFKLSKSDKPSPWNLQLREIGFDTGHITLSDKTNDLEATINVNPLGKPIAFSDVMGKSAVGDDNRADANTHAQDFAFGFKVHGHYHGAAVSGDGKTGGLLAVQSSNLPFPLQADLHLADVHIVLSGTITNPAALGAIDLNLRLAGNSMAHLYPLLGVTLPDTPPFDTRGHLSGKLGEPSSTFTYSNFSGHVGKSDLNGTVTYTLKKPRPDLAGKLSSKRLDFADLAPLIGGGSAAKDSAPDANASAQPKGKVLPTQKFRTERWKAMDADVTYKAKRIVHGKKLPIQDLQAHLLMKGGALTVAPLNFGIADGSIHSAIYLDGRAEPMKGRIDLHMRHLQLKQLFSHVKLMKKSLGEINGDAKLTATGNSVAALLGSSNGELKLLMDQGVVSKELMELAGLNIGNYIVTKLFGDKPVPINCAATDFIAKNGLMRTRLALIDTDNALINIDGTVNFATEKLDLNITPHTKGLRIFSLRSPLYVKGTFADPDVGVHVGKLLLRGGGALALGAFAGPAAALVPLIAPSKDKNVNPCRALLAQMRTPAKAPPAGQTQPATTKH